jgi:DNA-binding XRE family transcriptional regulator
MASKFIPESALPSIAKEYRLKAGKTKMQIATELGVTRPSVQLAEENPEQRLGSLRIRIIETYSEYKVEGPFYRLTKKKRKALP